MFRLGLITTLWQRPALTASVLAFYGTLAVPGVTLALAAAGSEGAATESLAARHGFAYAETPNEPLSDKHNAALQLVKDADAVMVVGSDDFVHPSWITLAVDHIRQGAAVVSKRGCHFTADLDSVWFCPAVVTGAGAAYSRAALDGLGWNLWPPGLDRGLDKAAAIRASRFGPWVETSAGGPVLDVKSGTNRFSMSDVHRWGATPVAPSWLATQFPNLYDNGKL